MLKFNYCWQWGGKKTVQLYMTMANYLHSYIRFKWRLNESRLQHPKVDFLEERV